MPGFDYKFLEKPKRRFQCPLCSKAMREPVQVSTCGHRFCDTCLQEFLSEGVFNLLEWPFSYKVTFSILDQSDPSLSKPQHITETFNPDPNWKNFQKPSSSRNSLDESTLGFGYPKFISHDEIKKRNYIRDNCVFIKASIEIPQKIMT
uniref:Tnf receptor-associated factor 4a n=1 Tax=Gasterosteus aculeatus TaxID=69293 RepID=G3PAX9_GASAC